MGPQTIWSVLVFLGKVLVGIWLVIFGLLTYVVLKAIVMELIRKHRAKRAGKILRRSI